MSFTGPVMTKAMEMASASDTIWWFTSGVKSCEVRFTDLPYIQKRVYIFLINTTVSATRKVSLTTKGKEFDSYVLDFESRVDQK